MFEQFYIKKNLAKSRAQLLTPQVILICRLSEFTTKQQPSSIKWMLTDVIDRNVVQLQNTCGKENWNEPRWPFFFLGVIMPLSEFSYFS